MTSTETKTLLPVVYEQTEQTLIDAAKLAKGLKIAGVEDSAGYRRVHETRQVLKGLRVAIEKQRVDLKAGALDYGRRVDAEARRLTALVEPTELELEAEQKRIDAEKERIRAEAELARKAKLDERVARFAALGVSVAPSAVQDMPDDEFAEALEFAAVEYRARVERERIAAEEAAFEAAAKEQAEAEAKRVERERLAKERADLEAERARQAAERKRLDDEAAKVRAEQQAAQAKLEAERAAFERERAAKVEAAKPVPVPETAPLFPEISEAGPVTDSEGAEWTEDEQEAIGAASTWIGDATTARDHAIRSVVGGCGDDWDAASFACGYLAGVAAERARKAEGS